MNEIESVVINPVEWDFKRFKCYRYLKIEFDESLSKDKLLSKLNEYKIRNVKVKQEQNLIRWQYKNRPPILISSEEQCVRTEIAALDDFDREDIEHQAGLVLRLLKKFGLARFLRKRVSFLPSLVGYDEIERRQYHELVERGIRRRFEIYGYSPIANKKMSRKRVDENKNQAALKRHEEVEILTMQDSTTVENKAEGAS